MSYVDNGYFDPAKPDSPQGSAAGGLSGAAAGTHAGVPALANSAQDQQQARTRVVAITTNPKPNLLPFVGN